MGRLGQWAASRRRNSHPLLSTTHPPNAQSLAVRNLDQEPLVFTAALHTYYHVGDIHSTRVTGLQGYQYIDKPSGGTRRTEEQPAIAVVAETDRVYCGTGEQVQIRAPALQRLLTVRSKGWPDTVVWNAHAERAQKIADLGNDDWLRYICVEAAAADTPITVAPNQVWEGTQSTTLSALTEA